MDVLRRVGLHGEAEAREETTSRVIIIVLDVHCFQPTAASFPMPLPLPAVVEPIPVATSVTCPRG